MWARLPLLCRGSGQWGRRREAGGPQSLGNIETGSRKGIEARQRAAGGEGWALVLPGASLGAASALETGRRVGANGPHGPLCC